MNDSKRKYLPTILFLLFNLLTFVQAFIANIHCAIFACAIIVVVVCADRNKLSSIRNPFFIIYFSILLLSGVAYIFNRRPISLYFTCITYNLLPMLMYGIGGSYQEPEENNDFFRGIVIGNTFAILFALALYAVPSLSSFFHVTGMADAGIKNGVGYRLYSYFDSLELGNICAIGVAFIMMLNYKRKWMRPFLLLITVACLFLTMQRGSWIIGVGSLVGSFLIASKKQKRNLGEGFKTFFQYALIAIFAVVVIYIVITRFMSDDFLRYLSMRINVFNLGSMYGDRSHQVKNGLEIFSNYPLGYGMGSVGIKAASYNLQVVPDNNIVKILVESGLFGFIAFVFLNIHAIIRGLRAKRYACVMVVLFYLVQSTGSNVIDYYYTSFIYWAVLGYLSNYIAPGEEPLRKLSMVRF